MAKIKTPKTIKKYNFKLKEFEIQKLKGVSDCKVLFEPHRVTAIMGINGSGKSTILHALACCFKPVGTTSKAYNRFSDFFTNHTHSKWIDSKFSLTHEYTYFNPISNSNEIETATTEYGKNKRWTPIYARRPERENTYIGLQNLPTLSDHKGAGRYASYSVKQYPHSNLHKVIQKMSYIIGRNYSDVKLCKSKFREMLGLEYNNIVYSEHTMGAGEKRVLEILLELYEPKLQNGGLLLIDELDVLLHESAFSKLVETLIEASEENKNEIVFTTHRETVTTFKEQLNITSVWNTGNKVITLPHIDPKIITQLTNSNRPLMTIIVEDELATIVVEKVLDSLNATSYCQILKFGAADNAFTVITGLLLANQNIKNYLCVLDGDVYITEEEKQKQINSYLSGNDKETEKEVAIKHIKQFTLPYNFSGDRKEKGLPEYNHKCMLEAIEELNHETLYSISKSLVGLTDWHEYYPKLMELTRTRNVEEKVLDLISKKSPMWNDYTKEISEWIKQRLPSSTSLQ